MPRKGSDMAIGTKCQTPGAQYHTHVHEDGAVVSVHFGQEFDISKEEAILLEKNIHNAMELVLAPLYAK